jgi:phosphotransferase system enzyme I (PtsI)
MAPAAVAAVGARLESVTAGLCDEAAEAALGALSPQQGREAVAKILG